MKKIVLIALLITGFAYAQTDSPAPPSKVVTPMKTNTVAVLPVSFVNTQSLVKSGDMSKLAQNDIYQELITQLSNIYPLTVQDLRTTNGLLRKAGISHENVDEVSIEELQEVLGVDNLVSVLVQYTTKTVESSSTYGSAKVDEKQKRVSGSESSSKTENIKYDYKIYLDIYTNGTKVYTKSREPFFDLKDSWVDSVHYLLKRSPIYKK